MRIEATRFADDTRNPSTLFFPLLAQLAKAFRRTMELFVLRAPPALGEPFNGLDQRSKHSNNKKQVRNRLALVELPPSAQPPPGHPTPPAGFNSSPCPPFSQRPFVCSCVSLTAVLSHRGRNRRRLQVPAAHLLTSSHLAPHPRPPPGFHAGCRVVAVVFRQDGVPASSALATSLRANTYFPRIPGQAEAPLGRRGPRGSGNSQVGRGGR